MERTNKEIGEACARNIAKFNEATRVENPPFEGPMTSPSGIKAGRAYFAAREAKIAEFMQKNKK